MMSDARTHLVPSAARNGGAMSSALRAARPSRSLADARDDSATTTSIASAHGSAVYLHEIAQPSAHAPPLMSSRDQRSYDTSRSPRTPHSLHAQPTMII